MSQLNAAPGNVTRPVHTSARRRPDQPANLDFTRANASSSASVTSGPQTFSVDTHGGPGGAPHVDPAGQQHPSPPGGLSPFPPACAHEPPAGPYSNLPK